MGFTGDLDLALPEVRKGYATVGGRGKLRIEAGIDFHDPELWIASWQSMVGELLLGGVDQVIGVGVSAVGAGFEGGIVEQGYRPSPGSNSSCRRKCRRQNARHRGR